MSNLNTNFDSDLDTFLNLDSTDYTPVSASPALKTSTSSSSTSHYSSSSQQSFAGPSYQYDQHRQQTGLPIGGLANTFAVNQASGLHYRPNQMGFVMPTETLNIPLALDDFDFGRSQSLDMGDMDFDADSPADLPSMFYGQGESSQTAPIQRMYPGIHSQQAAQAKAAQEQKQQGLGQQQPKQIPGQRPLPTQVAKAKDPHVEESISRLLNRMRQSSSASVEGSSPGPSAGMSGMPRTKKEEDDMDEDERLLASEEGKKLSSKERRQLRNKVSARAFRSRRKEYIGQLEGEVAAKVQEANDLRTQNRQLMEENTRLTDLTRMLLSSQAFSGFLQELSNSGVPAPNIPTSQSMQAASKRKDVSAHEAARQMQSQNIQHVGMTTIPEQNIDMSGLDLSSNSWNALPSNDFQVFAVASMPEVPVLDISGLNEKKSSRSTTWTAKESIRLSALPPARESTPTATPKTAVDESVELDEESFSLYADSPAPVAPQSQSAQSLIASLSKPHTSVEVAKPVSDTSGTASLLDLKQLCEELEESCARVARFLRE